MIPYSLEAPLTSNYLLSNREDIVAFDVGAREAESRRTINPCWPFRYSAYTMTE